MERVERSVAPSRPASDAAPEHNGSLERTTTRHDERFERRHRLRAAADFARIRQQGRRLNSQHLTLSFARCAPSADSSLAAPTRIGFSISKRVGDAVRRNLVKRRLREHLRRALWNIAPGWDMIITARPGAAQADSETLRAETLDLLTRARLLNGADAPLAERRPGIQREGRDGEARHDV